MLLKLNTLLPLVGLTGLLAMTQVSLYICIRKKRKRTFQYVKDNL